MIEGNPSDDREPRRRVTSETGGRVDAVAEWRSWLTRLISAALLFEIVSGLAVYLLPFGILPQVSLIVHTLVGIIALIPIVWYLIRHWWVRRKGNLSHYQVLGYIAAVLILACLASGIVVTWQGFAGPRLSYAWDTVHLLTGLALVLFIVVHIMTIVARRVNNPAAFKRLKSARHAFYRTSVLGTIPLVAVCAVWVLVYDSPEPRTAFSPAYNFTFGEDRPFAPSLARVANPQWESDVTSRVLATLDDDSQRALHASLEVVDQNPTGLHVRIRDCIGTLDVDEATRKKIDAILAESSHSMRSQGALDARQLAGSAGCGTSGCHSDIYKEWLPSAHRYSSMDELFQRVQSLMAVETSPEHTRYCAGCHDPISLFSGAKNSDNITLSSLGADEGSSCLVCHSIVQTDVQGNGDYTIEAPQRYAYEIEGSRAGKLMSDFLIRTYPEHHITSYSKPLYKTAEFCGACHKQYVDREVNTDIGKVQGQNQYDSWKNSRWYHEGEPDKTINCRECHMPLQPSNDPASGDATDYNRSIADGKHRSHRMLASNQYVPLIHNLEGADEHVRLTEQWLRGEYEIPEIADKWTDGPVVRMEVIAPETVQPEENVELRVLLTNNKTGHDFPTGPLDMIESWIELIITDQTGAVVYHVGGVNDDGTINDSPLIFKADGFDRGGELIDRHNLWDLVGASYKRAMYPGMNDTASVEFQCPSMARGRLVDDDGRLPPGLRADVYTFAAPAGTATTLTVEAKLMYRKANPEFLDRVYGSEAEVRSPVSLVSRAQATIKVVTDGSQGTE